LRRKTVIEGIKLDFKAEELREHCNGRAKYHQGRADFYREEAKRMEGQEDIKIENDNLYSNSTMMSARKSMKEKANFHENRAFVFGLMRSHFIEETYRLSISDLSTLELDKE